MTKATTFFLILIAICLTRCTKEVTLDPVLLPKFLFDEVNYVKAFEDGGVLAYSALGVYVKMNEESECVFDADDFDFADKMINSMRLYKSGNIIVGVSDDWVMSVTPHNIEFSANAIDADLNQQPSFVDYNIDNEGVLSMLSFGDLTWDGLLNDYYYQLYLNRWESNNKWSSHTLGLSVYDNEIMKPSLAFDEQKLFVGLGDIYEFDISDLANISSKRYIIPKSAGYRNMYKLKFENNTLYGDNASEGVVSNTYSFDINAEQFVEHEFATVCGNLLEFNPPDRLFLTSDGKLFYYAKKSFWDDVDGEGTMFILTQKSGNCEDIAIEVESNEYLIWSIDYSKKDKTFLLATSDGLKVYDIETKVITNYFQKPSIQF